MPKPYGFEYNTSQTLKKMARERDRETKPDRTTENGVSPFLNIQGRLFVVILADTIDGATGAGSTFTISSGTAQVLYRTPDPGEEFSQDTDNTITADTLEAYTDIEGDTLYKRVWNPGTSDAPADVPLLATQDVWGDLYLINATGGSTPVADGIDYVHDDNDDALPCPAYGVLWKSGDGYVILSGTRYLLAARPTDVFDIHWFVNRGTPVNIGSIGVCDMLIDKPGPVRIDDSLIGTINIGDELGPKPNGGFTIWKGYQGFTATGPDYTISGAPVVKCIQHPVKRVFGRLYQDLTQNADGTASSEFEIWHRDTDNKRKPSGWEKITVYAPLLNKNEKAKQGVFGWADYHTNSKANVNWEGDFACDKDDTGSSQSVSPGALVANQVANSDPPSPDLSVAQGIV